MNKALLFLVLGALALLPCFAVAADEPEVLEIQSEDLEVGPKSEARLSVDIKAIPTDTEAVLEFTAWHQATKNAGFYASMRVFWNNEELEDIRDRPATFQLAKTENTTPIRKGKTWQVSVLASPEDANDQESRYYVSPEIIDVVRFRFNLPHLAAGPAELTIRNEMKDETFSKLGYELFPVLMLRDVKIRFEPR